MGARPKFIKHCQESGCILKVNIKWGVWTYFLLQIGHMFNWLKDPSLPTFTASNLYILIIISMSTEYIARLAHSLIRSIDCRNYLG